MKCLNKYKWVKLPREIMIDDKGIMNYYMKLASRVAFRKGIATYCGYENPVEPGMWAGGVGLKSILGVRKRLVALWIMNQLQELGYLTWTLDADTKLLTYKITDWVVECSGAACESGAVYASTGYGFYSMPRTITQRLVDKGYKFGPADAFLDLWCHTAYRDYGNAFSFLAPAIQFDKYGSVLTLETLGKRWGWEKTKVCRFFKKYEAYFHLYRLPASYGCVIFNQYYPTQDEVAMPEQEDVMSIFKEILIQARNTHTEGTRNEKLNRFVAWWSRRMLKAWEESVQNQSEDCDCPENEPGDGVRKSSVAILAPILRAYISHGRNCKYSRNCINDCLGKLKGKPPNSENPQIGAVRPLELPNPFSLPNLFYLTIGGRIMEQSYFQIQLDDTIRETEKLLKKLNAVKADYADKRIEEALAKSVTAAKISEGVALKTRALPAHTGHPKAETMVREAIAETVPVEIGFTDQDWLKIEMPILLPRKEKSSRRYIRGFLYPALEKFAFAREEIRYRNSVMIFRHVYDGHRPEREYRDHDNIELNTVVDAVAMFFLVDDTPLECRHYYCSAAGDTERTEVYIVPRSEFQRWLDMENDPPKIRQTEFENISVNAEKDTEIQPFLRKFK